MRKNNGNNKKDDWKKKFRGIKIGGEFFFAKNGKILAFKGSTILLVRNLSNLRSDKL